MPIRQTLSGRRERKKKDRISSKEPFSTYIALPFFFFISFLLKSFTPILLKNNVHLSFPPARAVLNNDLKTEPNNIGGNGPIPINTGLLLIEKGTTSIIGELHRKVDGGFKNKKKKRKTTINISNSPPHI